MSASLPQSELLVSTCTLFLQKRAYKSNIKGTMPNQNRKRICLLVYVSSKVMLSIEPSVALSISKYNIIHMSPNIPDNSYSYPFPHQILLMVHLRKLELFKMTPQVIMLHKMEPHPTTICIPNINTYLA